jgi:uncharacterized peroxidase-related enzyme
MAFIELLADDEASGEAAACLDTDRAASGYVPNYSRLVSARPAVYGAWKQLVTAVKGGMDERRYELATVAAARQLRSSYCMLAHGKVLADRFLPPETVAQLARDHHRADLDEVDVAVMDLAAKVAEDATSVTAADVERLRELGLTDDDVFHVVAAAAARSFFTKLTDSLGVAPDAAYGELDPSLRDSLVVGRPIERVGAG